MGKESGCRKFLKKVKSLDKFAAEIEFTVAGESGGNSTIAGFFAILMYIFAAFYFFYQLVRCFKRMDPSFIYFQSETEEVHLTIPEDHLAFVGIPKKFIGKRGQIYVNPAGDLCDYDNEDLELSCKDINFRECKDGEIDEDIVEDFSDLYFWCFDHGEFEMTENKVITIDFNVDKTEIPEDEEELNKFKSRLEDREGYFFFVDNYVTPDNFSEPIQEYINWVPISFSYDFYKIQNMHIREIEVETEWALLFNFEYTDHSFCAEDFSSFDVKDMFYLEVIPHYDISGDRRISELIIDTTYNKDSYKRSYKKIPDVLAATTSIVGTITSVISFILKPYTSFKLKEEFLKYVFDFDFTDKKETPLTIELCQPQKFEEIKKNQEKKVRSENTFLRENSPSINESRSFQNKILEKDSGTKNAIIKIGEVLKNDEKKI